MSSYYLRDDKRGWKVFKYQPTYYVAHEDGEMETLDGTRVVPVKRMDNYKDPKYFEKDVDKDTRLLVDFYHESDETPSYHNLVYLDIDNSELTSDNIESFRTGDTKRNLDPKGPQDIGKTISDLDINYGGKTYYISLKNKQGSGIYSGANIPWIYEKNGKVVYDPSKFDPSSGNGILFEMFNIDSKKIAKGLNDYINQTGKSTDFQSTDVDTNKFKKLLASSLGYGYYYVREYGKGDVKVIPLLTAKDSLNAIGTITSAQIKYPSKDTKQVTIKIDTDSKLFGPSQYVIAIRNTSGKILPLSLRISKTK